MRFLCMYFAKILIGEWNLQRVALFLSMSEHNLQSAYISWFRSHLLILLLLIFGEGLKY